MDGCYNKLSFYSFRIRYFKNLIAYFTLASAISDNVLKWIYIMLFHQNNWMQFAVMRRYEFFPVDLELSWSCRFFLVHFSFLSFSVKGHDAPKKHFLPLSHKIVFGLTDRRQGEKYCRIPKINEAKRSELEKHGSIFCPCPVKKRCEQMFNEQEM